MELSLLVHSPDGPSSKVSGQVLQGVAGPGSGSFTAASRCKLSLCFAEFVLIDIVIVSITDTVHAWKRPPIA